MESLGTRSGRRGERGGGGGGGGRGAEVGKCERKAAFFPIFALCFVGGVKRAFQSLLVGGAKRVWEHG